MTESCTGPPISPVPPGVHRPLWSVMIPTYNPSNKLELAIQSVLGQDPGPEQMQIEVLDNHSTVDTEAMVKGVGKGRVGFHRHPENLGVFRNFNACLERARGHWVQILPHDDMVFTGFYEYMAEMARQNPTASLLCCRSLTVHEDGNAEVTPILAGLEKLTNDPSELLYGNRLRWGVLLKRDFYERMGGFKLHLPMMSDWELLVRTIHFGGAVMTRVPLHYYRYHSHNLTTKLLREGIHASEKLIVARELQKMVPGVRMSRFRREAAWGAFFIMLRYRRQGDHEAAQANEKVWREIAPWWLYIPFRLLNFVI